MARTFGLGGGLAGVGMGQQREAAQLLGAAADQEQQREIGNQQLEQQRKAGNTQLGATVGGLGGMAMGAQMGAVGGPMGALIGGAIGAIAGGLF